MRKRVIAAVQQNTSPSDQDWLNMAVDLVAGRRLEPWLSGVVVRKGAELGIPTPADAFVCKALKPDVMGTPH